MAEQIGGCVVPAGDVRALAAAIREVWNHAEQWRSRAASAWDRAQVQQSVEKHVDAIESIYERVRSGRPVEASV
jgi:glycosyltransferase involved in cell wall biosynthesis